MNSNYNYIIRMGFARTHPTTPPPHPNPRRQVNLDSVQSLLLVRSQKDCEFLADDIYD